jgi:putative flippase GtrA
MRAVLTSLAGSGARFASVGAIATLLDACLFLLLAELGTDPGLSNVVSYAAASVVNFWLNREWTFAAREGAVLAQALRFAIMVLIGLTLSTAIVAEASLLIAPAFAKLLAIAVVLPVNYTVARLLVFHRPARTALAEARATRRR